MFHQSSNGEDQDMSRCSIKAALDKTKGCPDVGRKEGRKELVYLTSIIIIQNIHR